MATRFQAHWRSLGEGTRLLLGFWVVGSLLALGLRGALGIDLLAWVRLDLRAFTRLEIWRIPGYALATDDLLTLVFGGLFLGWLGTVVESSWNRGWFLFYYLACAAGTALAVLLFPGNPSPGLLTNAGAILGLLVAWHGMQRHRRFLLFGGPEVSATTAAVITALCILLPPLLGGQVRLALSLAAGGITGAVLLRIHSGVGASRARRAAVRPRMGRLEL